MANKPLDLAIIGAGPAALTAALYAARAGLAVTVFERARFGGALTEIAKISNYPGFTGTGPDLADRLREQATNAGATLEYGACTSVRPADHAFACTIDDAPVTARAVLVATGSEPVPLSVPTARPVSYCALCDGDLSKGQHLAVVGGGNSAFQEALYLASLAKDVTIISHSTPRADACLQSRVAETGNIRVLTDTEPTTDLLDTFDRVFVYIGKRPASTFLPAEVLDQDGYILTGTPETGAETASAAASASTPHSTSLPGLFAAGDIRSGALRQAITAAADGAAASVEIADFLKKHNNY